MKFKINFISSKNQLYISIGLLIILLVVLALSLLPRSFHYPMAKLIYSSSGLEIKNKLLNKNKTIFSNSYIWPNDTINSKNSTLNLLYLNESIYLTFDKNAIFSISKKNKISHIKIKQGRFRINNELPGNIRINNQLYNLSAKSQFEIDNKLSKKPIIKVFKGKITIRELDEELKSKQIFYNGQKQNYNNDLQEPFGFYNLIDGQTLNVAIRPYIGNNQKIKAVELAKQSNFSNILYRRNIDELDFFQLDLEPSIYFWRLVYEDNSTSLSTPFIILENLSYPQVNLANNFIFDKNNHLQELSVTDNDFTVFYKLEIATDITFQKIIETKIDIESRFNISNLPNGHYFYRFKAKNYQQNNEYTSSVSSFFMTDSVMKKVHHQIPEKSKEITIIDPPVQSNEPIESIIPDNKIELTPTSKPAINENNRSNVPVKTVTPKIASTMNPANNSNINLSGKKSIDFSWQAIPNATDYSLSITSNGKVISNKTLLKSTSFSFKQMKLLTIGSYKWKLSAINRNTSPPSTISEISNNFTISLDEMPPIVYTGEKNFLLANGPSQKITWQALSRTNKYAIMVYKKDDHNTRVLNATSSLTTFSLRLAAGYYSLSLAPFNEIGQLANNPTIIDIEVK